MERRFGFSGTGGELLGRLLVGYLLLIVTALIYLPWLLVSLLKYVYSRTTYGPTRRGQLTFDFSGTGGELFVKGLVGYLLTFVTLGLYAPWFMVNLARFFAEGSTARAEDGTVYRLEVKATGGELFGELLLGMILVPLTLGIYAPWLICRLHRLLAQRTEVLANNYRVGSLGFHGKGGDFFGTFLGGYVLTLITLGIYGPWFQVNMFRFFARNTSAVVDGAGFAGDFTGTGGELFGKLLAGYVLTILTLGIYSFWLMADLIRWWLSGIVVREAHR